MCLYSRNQGVGQSTFIGQAKWELEEHYSRVVFIWLEGKRVDALRLVVALRVECHMYWAQPRRAIFHLLCYLQKKAVSLVPCMNIKNSAPRVTVLKVCTPSEPLYLSPTIPFFDDDTSSPGTHCD